MPPLLPLIMLGCTLAVGLFIDPATTFLLSLGYLAMSGVLYVAYGIDKRAAQVGTFRTQESALHLLALMGGWPGALLAQRAFRHKTVKVSFQVPFWITVAVNYILLVLVLFSGAAPG